jgi:hypothetical protein
MPFWREGIAPISLVGGGTTGPRRIGVVQAAESGNEFLDITGVNN